MLNANHPVGWSVESLKREEFGGRDWLVCGRFALTTRMFRLCCAQRSALLIVCCTALLLCL